MRRTLLLLVFGLGFPQTQQSQAQSPAFPQPYGLEAFSQTVSFLTQDSVWVFADFYPAQDERRTRFERIASQRKTLYEQEAGVHGSSTLRPDKHPEGYAAIWEAVVLFLEHYARQGPLPPNASIRRIQP